MREVRVAHIALGLSSKAATSGDDAGGGSLWQALLSGHLLLPISLRGVSVRLARAPPHSPAAAALEAAAATAAGEAEEAGAAAAAPPEASGGPVGRSASGAKRARQLRVPLALLGHLPLLVDGLSVADEVRRVCAVFCFAWHGSSTRAMRGHVPASKWCSLLLPPC